MPVLAFLMTAVVATIAAGGSLRGVAARRSETFELCSLLLFIVQALVRSGFLPLPTRLVVLMWSALALMLMLLLLGQRDMLLVLVALGVGLNLLVILHNGHMPYAVPDSWSQPIAERLAVGEAGFYRPVATGTGLRLLGDILPTPQPSLASMGDVVLLVGTAAYFSRACLWSHRSRSCDTKAESLT